MLLPIFLCKKKISDDFHYSEMGILFTENEASLELRQTMKEVAQSGSAFITPEFYAWSLETWKKILKKSKEDLARDHLDYHDTNYYNYYDY